MNVTDELKREHQLILSFNLTLVEFAQKVHKMNDLNVFTKIAPEFTTFIEIFADDYHHSKEEDILFVELSKNNVLEHCNPIPVMLNDHAFARQLKGKLDEAIEKQDTKLFMNSAISYQTLMESHIFKEDHVLYGMAEDSLREDIKESIIDKYEDVETKKNKDNLWELFSSKLVELKSFMNTHFQEDVLV